MNSKKNQIKLLCFIFITIFIIISLLQDYLLFLIADFQHTINKKTLNRIGNNSVKCNNYYFYSIFK